MSKPVGRWFPWPRMSGSGWWKQAGSLWQDRLTQVAKKYFDDRRNSEKKAGTTSGDIVDHSEKTFCNELDSCVGPEDRLLCTIQSFVMISGGTWGSGFAGFSPEGLDLISDERAPIPDGAYL